MKKDYPPIDVSNMKEDPYPDLRDTMKPYSKKKFNFSNFFLAGMLAIWLIAVGVLVALAVLPVIKNAYYRLLLLEPNQLLTGVMYFSFVSILWLIISFGLYYLFGGE